LLNKPSSQVRRNALVRSRPCGGNENARTTALVLDLPDIEWGLPDTVSATMLAIDWLTEQPWVDRERVERCRS